MILDDLIKGFGLTAAHGGGGAIDVTDIADDSRRVTPGSLFIARGGTKADGKTYIADAIARGAAAVLAEGAAPAELPKVAWVVPEPGVAIDHALVSRLAERFFDHPGKKLKLVGVTGTNGKTTITFIVQHLLARAGVKAGVIGTVLIDDGATRTPAELTTPGGIDFSRHLAAMVRNGCGAAVAEVSSHALHQGRVAGLDFTVGIFTNLTGDHLDYHQTMGNYGDAKAILFDRLPKDGYAVVNADDPWSARMLRDCRARPIACSLKEREAAAQATIIELAAGYSRVRFEGEWGDVTADLPLVGRHNVINALQALAAATCLADVTGDLKEALEHCPAPPGRLELVKSAASRQPLGEPTVLVDYAHTHDALENVLTALRPVTRGKLIVVFGCGGDRDRTKRPKMAAVCCRLADRVVITSDNPRTEDPAFIIGQVLSGVPWRFRPQGIKPIEVEGVSKIEIERLAEERPGALEVTVNPDRAAAIRQAIAAAGPLDTVLIAGKGHEDYQIIGTTKRHFDDREQAREALKLKVA